MGFNTFPCNPYPISTEELNKGNNDDLNTRVAALESDVSDLNSNKANQITIAPFFNAETAYTAGDLVYYNGLSYRCTNDHEGEWDADDFAATTIANELDTLKSGLTNNYMVMGEMGAKNLIPYPYDRESGYSSQGVTVTYDKNGVMTVNKIAGTGTAFFALVSTTLNPNTKIVLKPNTSYILSLKLTNATNTSIAITKSTSGDIAAIRNKGDGYYETVFTTPEDLSVFTGIALYWASGATETNAIVEVMIRLASDTDNTYQPYAKTNKQLTDQIPDAPTIDGTYNLSVTVASGTPTYNWVGAS